MNVRSVIPVCALFGAITPTASFGDRVDLRNEASRAREPGPLLDRYESMWAKLSHVSQGGVPPTPAKSAQPLLAEWPSQGIVEYMIRIYEFGPIETPHPPSTGPDPWIREGVHGFRLLLAAPTNTPPPPPPPGPKAEPAPPTPTPATAPTTKPAEPTLDDLLGIKPAPDRTKEAGRPDRGTTGGPTMPDAASTDLDRLLTGEELAEAFKRAATLMGDAATRLDQGRDASIDTQRIQEEAIRNLDTLISQLQKQSSPQQQSSSQSKADKGEPRPQPRPNPTPSSQANPTDVPGSTRQDGPLKPGLESARAAWGALPARVREMLLQGSSDRFSSKYQQMTEQYYRKLAEEGK